MDINEREASLGVPSPTRVKVRCTNAFFVAHKGPVNPGEIVEVSRAESMDIVAANRGVFATSAEAAAGPMADFMPKDAEGKIIVPDRRSRARVHADQRAAQAAAQAQIRK